MERVLPLARASFLQCFHTLCQCMWSYPNCPSALRILVSLALCIIVPVWSVLLSVSTTKHALVLHTGLGHGSLLVISFKDCEAACVHVHMLDLPVTISIRNAPRTTCMPASSFMHSNVHAYDVDLTQFYVI